MTSNFGPAMRIYLYEHLTAGDDAKAPASLLVEGAAMFAAVAADLAAVPGLEVVRGRVGDDAAVFRTVDAALVIAPETGGVLSNVVAAIERAGCRLLSPSSEFCTWASDKSRVAATLQSAGVPMPRGVLLKRSHSLPDDFPFPAVLKPNDGCGSQGMSLLPPGAVSVCLLPSGEGGRRPDEGSGPDAGAGDTIVDGERRSPARSTLPSPDRCRDRPLPVGEAERYRVEEFVPGAAVSVALLRGAAGVFPLPACSQKLADDGTFAYLGGSCPLEPALAARAERLALRAAAAMPEWCGYIGLDLVLGQADDGSQDYLIEVNPRLTTSYVGLRALCETNLAAAMLDVAAGRRPRPAFRTGKVEFAADGSVSYA